MGTAIVLLLVAGAAALAIRQMIRDKRAGKSLSCGGDCSRCAGCAPGGSRQVSTDSYPADCQRESDRKPDGR